MRWRDKRKSISGIKQESRPWKKKRKQASSVLPQRFFLQFAPQAKECRTGIVVFFPLQMQHYTSMHQKILLTVLFPGYLEMQLLFFLGPGFEIISCANPRSFVLSFLFLGTGDRVVNWNEPEKKKNILYYLVNNREIPHVIIVNFFKKKYYFFVRIILPFA